MTVRRGVFFSSALLFLAAALPLAAAETASPSEFPAVVAEAIEADDCGRLVELNQAYWAEYPAADVLGELPDEVQPLVRALEQRIVELPICGLTSASLVQAEPVRGANFFDQAAPAGLTAERAGSAMPRLAPGQLGMRRIRPIAPGPVQLGQKFLPVHRSLIENAARTVIAAWNSPALAGLLGEEFYGRDQLLDAFSRQVPPGARLRLLSIGGIQTLQQQPLEAGAVASLVSVTVTAQLEYNSAEDGFVRREGTNELILRIVRRVPR